MAPGEGFCEEHMNIIRELATSTAKLEAATDAIAQLGKNLADAFQQIKKHIADGEGPGGARERLRDVEKQAKDLEKAVGELKISLEACKRDFWKIAIFGGIIGGLLGKITPEFFQLLLTFLKMHLLGG
jgi:chromosome segregation ATPase